MNKTREKSRSRTDENLLRSTFYGIFSILPSIKKFTLMPYAGLHFPYEGLGKSRHFFLAARSCRKSWISQTAQIQTPLIRSSANPAGKKFIRAFRPSVFHAAYITC